MKVKNKSNSGKLEMNGGKKNPTSIEQNRKISATMVTFDCLFSWDIGLSERFASFMQTRIPTATHMFESKFMEISGNEYVWFPALAVLCFMHPFVPRQLPINLALALAFDSAVILLIKALVRRRRPTAKNPDFFTAFGPDQYSFPSGHASRTILISLVFTQINPLFDKGYLNFAFSSLIWSWSISVCFSRMLNGRHYLFDVLTGVVIGVCEGSFIVSSFWMSPEQAESFLRFFSLSNASLNIS